MKEYTPETYLMLITLFKDDDESSRAWLLNHGHQELVEFFNAYEGEEKAFVWLMENGHRSLAATVDAMSGNDKAKVWLIKSGNRELAAFVDACSGNKTAVAWLIRLQQKGLIRLAHEVYLRNKKNEKKGFWGFLNFGNPFR